MSVAIWANSEFMQFRGSGIFSCKKTTFWGDLNHAVELIGYDANGNYIIKNSWGTLWGNQGYAVIDRRYSCGIGLYSVQYVGGMASAPANNATKNNTATGSLMKNGVRSVVALLLVVLLVAGMI
jgi:hypothetical protein